jgi:hypothetical protein
MTEVITALVGGARIEDAAEPMNPAEVVVDIVMVILKGCVKCW